MQQIHRTLGFVLLAVSTALIGQAPAQAATILNTLNADKNTSFSVLQGAGGLVLIPGNYELGPVFTLASTTFLTEIGGFINNCDQSAGCTTTLPVRLNLYSTLPGDGFPDPNGLIGTWELTDDGDTLRSSYQYATPNLILSAGTYAALFSMQNNVDGLLFHAQNSYLSGTVPAGRLWDGVSSFSSGERMAIVVEGSPVPEPGTGMLLLSTLGIAAFLRRNQANSPARRSNASKASSD